MFTSVFTVLKEFAIVQAFRKFCSSSASPWLSIV